MQALMIKDWRLMKGQKYFFLMIGLFMLVYGMTGRNLGFFASYLTVMTAMFTISTISYDEYNHGMLYLFTFPISRKMYVLEKYLFCMITTVAAAGGTFLMTMGIRFIRNSEVTMEELLISITVAIALSMLILCYMTPIQLKFGSEKSRVALLAVMAGVFVAVYMCVLVLKKTGKDVDALLAQLEHISKGKLIVGVVAVLLVLMTASFSLSERILEHKEF